MNVTSFNTCLYFFNEDCDAWKMAVHCMSECPLLCRQETSGLLLVNRSMGVIRNPRELSEYQMTKWADLHRTLADVLVMQMYYTSFTSFTNYAFPRLMHADF